MLTRSSILVFGFITTLVLVLGAGLLGGAAHSAAPPLRDAAFAALPAGPMQGTPTPTATATAGCSALPAWQPGPPHTPAREYIQGATGSDGKFYTAGGWVAGTPAVTNEASRYNPTTNSWESLPPLPVPEGVYGMAAANGKIYVVGGSDIPTRTLTTTVQIFDIAANTWSFGPSVPRATGVQGPAVAALNNRLYVIGGADNNNVYDTNDILDLTTNTWTAGAALPNALFLTAATVANGRVYVFGGADNNGNSLDTLYAYDPGSNTWATLAPANTGGFGVDPSISPYGSGWLLATFGTDYATFATRTTATGLYDIATNTWSAGPPVNNARYGNAQATLLDGRVMIYGGSAASARIGIGSRRAAAGPAVANAPEALTASSEILPAAPPAICTATVTPTATGTSTPPATATATATASPTVCTLTFNDVPANSTFYPWIRCLACRGIVGGYPCGGPGEPCPGAYYRPNSNVTRGQVAKIVSESAGFSDPVPSTQQTFEDVAPGSTFHLWVERLSVRGIIQGYPCGGPFEPCVAPTNRPYFRPNNNVTRGQLSKITSGAAGWTETPTGQTFQDVAPGSTFYLYIERMAARGIIQGYPCGGPFEPCVAPGNRPYFRPNNNATRGQMSKIAAQAFFPNCQTPARLRP